MSDERSLVARLRRIDESVYRVERVLITGVIAVMTSVVFLAVVWRAFAAPEGRLESIILDATADPELSRTLGNVISLLIWAGLCIFATRTAQRDWPFVKVVAVGLLAAAGFVAFGYGFVKLFPSGLVFSQRLALALLMWMVFLGSSMAAHARRHIFVQAAMKLVPERLRALHAAVGLVIAAGFAIFLAWISLTYANETLERWFQSNFRAARFDSIAIPYWTVTFAVPLGLGMTALRFLFQAFLISRGEMSPTPASEETAALKEAVDGQAAAGSEA